MAGFLETLQSIPDECFGGSNAPHKPSAYLLIYERTYPEMAELHTFIRQVR